MREAARKSIDDLIYKETMAERARMHSQVINELEEYDACIMTGPTNMMHFVGLPSLALKLCTGENEIPKGIIIYGADESIQIIHLVIPKTPVPVFWAMYSSPLRGTMSIN